MAAKVFGSLAGKGANGVNTVGLATSTRVELKDQVGSTAGRVWQALSTQGPLTMAELKKKVDGQGDLVTLAIGWLAREDKIEITPEKKTLRVQLK